MAFSPSVPHYVIGDQKFTTASGPLLVRNGLLVSDPVFLNLLNQLGCIMVPSTSIGQ
jgi:hypothetical protein